MKSASKLWSAALAGTLAALALDVWIRWPLPGYADTGLPMLLEADSYYFLALAEQGGSGLSLLISVLAAITGLSLPTAATALSLLLPLAMSFWFGAWATLLRFPPLHAGLCAFLAGLVPAWMERCGLGKLDTDPGIAWFWQGLLWSACLMLMRPGARRQGMACFAACALGMAWWWKPGALLTAFLLLLLIFLLLRRPGLRMLWLGTALLAGAALLLLPDSFLPEALAGARLYALDHARLVLGFKAGLIYESIEELRPVGLNAWLTQIGGSAPGGLIALAALSALLRLPMLLIPTLGMLALGMTADRFLYLTAPTLGLVWGLWLGRPALSRRVRTAVAAGGIFLLCSLFWGLLHRENNLPFQEDHDRAALILDANAPQDAPVWAWWDDAYFLRARSGLRPYFDGGSQTPEAAWTVARPLAQENPLLARRWIRFFALRGAGALEPLRAAWGENALWPSLERVFAASDPAGELAALPPLPSGHDAYAWLFPKGQVYLYLNQRFLRISSWWLAFGEKRQPGRQDLRHSLALFPRAGFAWNPETHVLTLPPGAEDYKGSIDHVFDTGRAPLSPPWGGAGVSVVTVPGSHWIYIANRRAMRSVAFRLQGAWEAMPGFRLLTRGEQAAAWEVEAE